MKRKVWPIFAWISGAIWVFTLALVWVTSFVDGRWDGIAWMVGMIAFFSTPVAPICAAEGYTFEKKPRGWRKERRRAEKEAYIRRLEQELLNE